VEALPLGTNRRGKHAGRFNIEITPGILPLLKRAAAARGVSPTSYIRRAMLSFIAHDLNKPFEAVLQHDPRVSGPGSTRAVVDLEGNIGGSWEIEDLR
jgi:hypothetical protein